jgi:hypothetical protein
MRKFKSKKRKIIRLRKELNFFHLENTEGWYKQKQNKIDEALENTTFTFSNS